MQDTTIRLIIGFCGLALFAARFMLPWLASERVKRSIVRVASWCFSLGGGLTLLAYAIHRHDPVIIAGQRAGVFVYWRNLYLVYTGRQKAEA